MDAGGCVAEGRIETWALWHRCGRIRCGAQGKGRRDTGRVPVCFNEVAALDMRYHAERIDQGLAGPRLPLAGPRDERREEGFNDLCRHFGALFLVRPGKRKGDKVNEAKGQYEVLSAMPEEETRRRLCCYLAATIAVLVGSRELEAVRERGPIHGVPIRTQ